MQNFINKTAKFLAYLSGLILFLIASLTFINFLLYALNRLTLKYGYAIGSISGYEELVTLFVLIATMFMLPYCQLKSSHIRLTFITSHLPDKIKTALDTIWLSSLAVLVTFLLYQMVFGMLDSLSDSIRLSILNWSEWPFFIPSLISLFVWLLVLILQVYISLRTLIKPHSSKLDLGKNYD